MESLKKFDAQEQIFKLRREIDLLTHRFHLVLNQDVCKTALNLLDRRYQLIQALCQLAQQMDKEQLRNYLVELQQRDQQLIHAIHQEQAHIKRSLFNLHKVKQYTAS